VEPSEEAGVNGEAGRIRDALWQVLWDLEAGDVDAEEASARINVLDSLTELWRLEEGRGERPYCHRDEDQRRARWWRP
jgi:hypothetical protein